MISIWTAPIIRAGAATVMLSGSAMFMTVHLLICTLSTPGMRWCLPAIHHPAAMMSMCPIPIGDVNFHGGRDQFNTVVVDESVRNETEQGYMAWATFMNEGERYGAADGPHDK